MIEIFENWEENWVFHQIRPKSRLSKIKTKMAIDFWWFWSKSGLSKILRHNRDLPKNLTKIEIFRKFWLKSRFFENVYQRGMGVGRDEKIENILQGVPPGKFFYQQNPFGGLGCISINYKNGPRRAKEQKSVKKKKKFEKSRAWPKFRFSKIFSKIVIFLKVWPKPILSDVILPNSSFLFKWWPKSKFFENFDQNREFLRNFN